MALELLVASWLCGTTRPKDLIPIKLPHGSKISTFSVCVPKLESVYFLFYQGACYLFLSGELSFLVNHSLGFDITYSTVQQE
jgi:hypothetical protein